ncbi:MAG: dihydroorotase [Clostridia bacterium]|nr:dihydroorotase [Clostridia bacterium]
MNICIAGGRLVDPAMGMDSIGDIYIKDGVIAAIRAEGFEQGDIPGGETERIEADGALVTPGLIDLHVHFRDPGFCYKEDMHTGCASAAAGGFTTVCMMPNLKPVTDTPELAADLAKRSEGIRALPVGSITMGQKGVEIVDIAGMKAAGACAISEDGRSVMDAAVMYRAMEQAAKADMPVFDHTEDDSLAGTAAGEAVIAVRDMLFAKETGCRLHLCHISCGLCLDAIRTAKENGLDVTAETGPHYFVFDKSRATHGHFKMNPPLRTKEDVQAVIEAIKDGTLDVIATDHAPHSPEEKLCGYDKAMNGIIGLETSFPVSYTALVRGGHIDLERLIRLMSTNPAAILHDGYRGTLRVGAAADVAVFDIDTPYVIDPASFKSKGRNTPFEGMEVYGRTLLTICGGKIVYSA